MRLLLVRHAQTTSNLLGLLDSGTPGPDLTDLGAAQAAAVAVALRGRDVASVHASTMIRTQQTAAPLALERGLRIDVHEGLREIEAGHVEMRSDLESLKSYTDVVFRWAEGELDPRIPGAEDGHEFFERFDSAVESVMDDPADVPVIFSHGASIRVWAGLRCTDVGPGFAAENELHNTGSVLVERTPLGWNLLDWRPGPMGGPSLSGRSGPGPFGGNIDDLVGDARVPREQKAGD